MKNRGKEKGKATITSTYKGNTYRCKIIVNQKADKSIEEKEDTKVLENSNTDKKKEHPVMNVTSDYELYNSDWMDIFIEGKGDCMASRCAMGTLCRYIGVRAWECNNLDYHGKTLVKADGVYYMFITNSVAKVKELI